MQLPKEEAVHSSTPEAAQPLAFRETAPHKSYKSHSIHAEEMLYFGITLTKQSMFQSEHQLIDLLPQS